MPFTEVLFFRAGDGRVPLVEWLSGLDGKARTRCVAQIQRLEAFGHELRRPAAENLGLGVYELRVKVRGVNLRMLYFFHGKRAVVVTQGFSKQRSEIPAAEVRLALRRKEEFEADPTKHTFKRGL